MFRLCHIRITDAESVGISKKWSFTFYCDYFLLKIVRNDRVMTEFEFADTYCREIVTESDALPALLLHVSVLVPKKRPLGPDPLRGHV